MRFLRLLGDSLSWNDDRMALTVFAHISTPQIRLTNDPNTVFFFLDHLQDRPPFRLEDDTTWDTNLEQGIAWGLRLLEKDREIHGPSPNAKLFVLISDGESWSGEVARAIQKANEANVPLFVIGAGTLSGGMLPAVRERGRQGRSVAGTVAARSRVAAAHCRRGRRAAISSSIAIPIATSPTRSSTPAGAGPRPKSRRAKSKSCIWRFLAAAVAVAAIGAIFLRERAELVMHVAGAGLAALSLAGLLW